MTIILRDYQDDLVDRTRAAMRQHRRVLMQCPTGGGKTAIATAISEMTSSRGRLVYFICHRAELVYQTSKTFTKFGVPHGIIAAGYPMDLRQKVQVCSVDTLKNRADKLPTPALCIWDECHHIGAAGWARLMEFYGSSYHVGLSATPVRLDGTGLHLYFDDMVLGPSVTWLMEQGHLANYRIFAPNAPDLKGVGRRAGEYIAADLEAKMDKPKLVGDIISHWQRHGHGLATIGFAPSVAFSKYMAEQFNMAGIPAAHLDGGTSKTDRAAAISRYAAGEILVLWNSKLFGEGLDMAALAGRDVTIDCGIDAGSTLSLSWYLQKIGRILRPKPGKVAVWLDHAGNSSKHGFPDDPREWSLLGKEKGNKDTDNGPPPPVTCPKCFEQIRRPVPDVHTCGHVFKTDAKPVEVAEGELRELTAEDKRAIRARLVQEQADAKTLGELVALAQKRGYKSPQNWAWNVWANRK